MREMARSKCVCLCVAKACICMCAVNGQEENVHQALHLFWRWWQHVCFYRKLYRLFFPINGQSLTAFIPSIETNESVAGSGCMAFKGIYSVPFVLVISVKNRKLFSHLIHIKDKMRN